MVRRCRLVLILAFTGSLTAGCGGPKEVPAPPISVEDDLKPGMKPEEVTKLLGGPDEDVVDPSYNPRVIREFSYKKHGLCLRFHTEKGLGYVEVHKRWDKPVLGLRYDDVIRASEIVKDEKFDNLKSKTWPRAYFIDFSAETPKGETGEFRKVGSIVVMDEDIYGNWTATIRLNHK
jgi:hypothetical protein